MVTALHLTLFVVVGGVYVYRRRILSKMEFDDDVKEQYLLMERANNNKDESTDNKDLEKVHISAVKTMITRTVTATDLMWNISA